MATGGTGFSDVVHDLISVQYHALKGGREYEQYIRDANEEGQPEIADFFRTVLEQDAERAVACHRYLSRLSGHAPAGSIVR
ncbi:MULTISPECIES: acyl carrier protein [Protofrankia]|uniref:Acyl carrier protein n=2 Tax=Protofrankia TaxID=2994361 RepID=F8B692_9ACTN|nr:MULTISPECIES: acyl carrier protein [Protofrankia]AEH08062.1 hypothetical protein FsymDg_0519 [Candidatus Protofrankia datiscae]KLL10698.1 acyl carrier protein [Protofrankia coriariae]